MLTALSSGQPQWRLGLSIPRRVGPAVVRNRIKRRLREVFRRFVPKPESPVLDVCVQARPEAADVDSGTLTAEFLRLLEQAGFRPDPARRPVSLQPR